MSESAQREAWKSYDANEREMVEIAFGSDRLRVARPTTDAWRALEAIFAAHGYEFRADDTHGYFPRNVKDTNVRSLHAFGLALDVNATTNPMRMTPDKRPVRFSRKQTQRQRALDVINHVADTDMTPQMIADVRAIRTGSGKTLFGWGGDWSTRKDTMHFYIDVSPSDLATGVDRSTVRGGAFEHRPTDFDGYSDSSMDHHDHHHRFPGQEAWDLTEGTPMQAQSTKVLRFRTLLDFIARHEGTADRAGGGYDTSLGFGILTGGEKQLSRMTLGQIDSLQRSMLDHPKNRWNSSALGRYQIVRKTLRGLREELGLSDLEVYSAELQDRLAVALVERRGRDVVGLRNEWASLVNVRGSDILAAYDDISTVVHPAEIAVMHKLPVGPIEGLQGLSPAGLELLVQLVQRLTGAAPLKTMSEAQAVLKPGDRGPEVKALQEALNARDYQVGKIDGIYGTLTTAAVAAFQVDYKVNPETVGSVDAVTWAALREAPARPLSLERRNTTADDLRRDGSVIVQNADRTRQLGWLTSIFGGLGLGNSAIANFGPSADTSKESLARSILNSQQALTDFFGASNQQLTGAIQKAHEILGPASGVAKTSGQSAVDALGVLLPQVVGSLLPGAGGSLVMLGLGIASHIYGTRIVDRRVADQRNGSNIGPLRL